MIYNPFAVVEFGLERQLYSTVEESGGVEVCVEVLQGNVTQRTLIGIGNSIGSVPGKYHCQNESDCIVYTVLLNLASHICQLQSFLWMFCLSHLP